jgi:hypothetical protein
MLRIFHKATSTNVGIKGKNRLLVSSSNYKIILTRNGYTSQFLLAVDGIYPVTDDYAI